MDLTLNTLPYQVIVVGSNLSGLASASLLARKGVRVLVIDLKPEKKRSALFDLQPDHRPLTNLGSNQVLDRLLMQIEVPYAERELFRKADPSYQLILPDHRLDISANREHLYQEFSREFPDQLPLYQNQFKELDRQEQISKRILREAGLSFHRPDEKPFRSLSPRRPKGWKPRRESSAYEENRPIKDPFIQKLLEAQLLFFTHLEPDAISTLLRGYLLGTGSIQTYWVPGGRSSLLQILKNRIRHYGGEIIETSSIRIKYIKRPNLFSLEINEKAETLRGLFLVGNTTPLHIYSLLPKNLQDRSLRLNADLVKPTSLLATIHLEVDPSLIPEPMAEYSIVLKDPEQPLERENVLLLSFFSPPNSQIYSPEKKLLAVSFRLPFSESGISPQKHQSLFQKILDTLEVIFPFARSGIQPLDLEGSLAGTNAFQIHGNFFSRIDRKRHTGVPLQTPTKHLYLVGKETFPALGFEGEVWAGLIAANKILQDLGKI